MKLISPAQLFKNSIHAIGLDLVRWPFSSERFDAQVLSCLRCIPISGVIDVGARDGTFSKSLSSFQPFESIILVEPDPDTLSSDSLNQLANRVDIIHAAAFSHSAVQNLYCYSSPDFNSLLVPNSLGVSLFPESFRESRACSVRVETIDTLVLPLINTGVRYILKVDAQGVDYEVLKGAQSILPFVDVICTEVSFQPIYHGQARYNDVFAFLEARSFKLSSLTPVTRDSRRGLIEANALFVRSS
jgi:FkbM family methyltransferase